MRWTLKPKPEISKVETLQQALQVDEVVASLLVQRGYDTFEKAKAFFRPSLDDLHDPFLMKDMDKALERILKALDDNQRILVYGDYDVDGTTSVALMFSFLKTKTDLIDTYIPDRYDEGYGISFQGIDFAADNNFTLIIALDCGIKAIEKIAYAKNKGIDFIICDHHRPGEQIPDAVAVLDPKREDCNYPFKELCGCGVGFKLISALALKFNQSLDELIPYLDLVATAIGADIVPITGENRVMAYFGLQVINNNPRTGIKALKGEVKKDSLTITDVVFIIAPRINAAGRMKHGNYAVSLLVENNEHLAADQAKQINSYNLDRREADQQITVEALSQIEKLNDQDQFTTVVYDESWHKGVIGIVASRLTETYYRPTIVFTKSGDKLAASARSVKGFDVYQAIEACSAYIEQFGGHKYAAGLTIRPEHYEAFKAKFEEVVSNTIDPKLLTPELLIDTEIELSQINSKLYRIIQQMAPFGPGNMTPVFITQQVKDTGWSKCVGEHKDHLKVSVQPANTRKPQFSGIGFRMGNKINLIKNNSSFNIAYSLDENHWNGQVSLQLRLKDVK